MLAYYEGYACCKGGGKKEECPFPKKCDKRKLWLRGFKDCSSGVELPSLTEIDSIETGMKKGLTNEE